jgi:hypothetical protein
MDNCLVASYHCKAILELSYPKLKTFGLPGMYCHIYYSYIHLVPTFQAGYIYDVL